MTVYPIYTLMICFYLVNGEIVCNQSPARPIFTSQAACETASKGKARPIDKIESDHGSSPSTHARLVCLEKSGPTKDWGMGMREQGKFPFDGWPKPAPSDSEPKHR
jgi:hypothetical protein